ncbi:MAG: hypothetical protein D6685_17555, partial [Bacteroidetes bacterium]
MRFIKWSLAAAAIVLIAAPSYAAVKVYDSTKDPGDLTVIQQQNCPAVSFSPLQRKGYAIISDTGSGTVTLDELVELGFGSPRRDLSFILGPGAFF